MFAAVPLPILNREINEDRDRLLSEPRFREVSDGLSAWSARQGEHSFAVNLLSIDILMVRNALCCRFFWPQTDQAEAMEATALHLGANYLTSRFGVGTEGMTAAASSLRTQIFGIGNLFVTSFRELSGDREIASARTFWYAIEETAAMLNQQFPEWRTAGANFRARSEGTFRMADQAKKQRPN